MNPVSFLLIKPGSMGDVVHALPVVEAIREARPDVRLTWIIDPRWAPLLGENPGVAQQIPFPRASFRGPGGILRAVRWYAGLRHIQPDLVLDLQGLLRSALMAKVSGGRTIFGLDDAREGANRFYQSSAKTIQPEHAVRRYLRILPLAGIAIPETCRFPLPSGIAPVRNAPYILLHPFARGAGKSLDAAQIRAFLVAFRQLSAMDVLIVGSGEVPDGLPHDVSNLAGKTSLLELIGLLRGAQFVVSVDSGPMHLAAALGSPLLGIHTWSDPRRVGPYSEKAWIWQGGELRQQDLARPPLAKAVFTEDSAREVARHVAFTVS